MSEIVFLGVGGAMPSSPAHNYTALVLRDGGATILLDCGPGIMRQLELANVDYANLTHVYVSHQHGDHSLGLPMLLLHRAIFYPDRPLLVLAAPPVLDLLTQLNALAYPDLQQMIDAFIECVPLHTGPEMTPLAGAPGVCYSLAPGKHSVPTWGVRLALPNGRSVVFSGDTGPSRQMAALAAGADLLVHDTFYLTPPSTDLVLHTAAGQVGELAAEAGVRAVALVHRMDTTEAAAAHYRERAAKHFEGEILVPNAGDQLTLG